MRIMQRNKEVVALSVLELLALSLGLSMDACAVSICKGACMPTHDKRQGLAISLSFGLFQGLMPLLGWFLGTQLQRYIEQWDHWIAFGLLLFLGGKLVWDALHAGEELVCTPLDIKELLLLSIATSVDALAAGIALAVLQVRILPSVLTIGLVTAVLCWWGVLVGSKFGEKFHTKAQMAGGITLVLIGLRILLDHLGVLA